jgi:hypothetical protein
MAYTSVPWPVGRRYEKMRVPVPQALRRPKIIAALVLLKLALSAATVALIYLYTD